MGPRPQTKRAETRTDKASSKPSQPRWKAKSTALSRDSISINATKSKIRNVQRLLDHSQDLPPGVRIEKERALAGYKQDLEKAVEDRNRSEIVGKYHMVRFFERRKAERALKKARALLAGLKGKEEGEGGPGEAEREELRKKVHVAEVDVNYTMYYPLTEKYVSLFPKKGDSQEGQDSSTLGPSNKPPVWGFVEQCMASGKLDMLRDGKYGIRPDGRVKTREECAPKTRLEGEAKKRRGASSKSNAYNAEDAAEESDGGFFEK